MGAVSGRPLVGPRPVLRELLLGENAVLVEVTAPAGMSSPQHSHDHESLVYVVAGRVRASFADDDEEGVVLEPGDAVRHPAGVTHGLLALQDSIWIEVKSPPERTWPAPRRSGA